MTIPEFYTAIPIIEKKLGLKFNKKGREILTVAFTHSTYANDFKLESNERLEYLGDGVLGYLAAEYVYTNFPKADEFQLTNLRQTITSREPLEEFIGDLGIFEYLITSGRVSSQGKIKSNLFEAVFGAIYLAKGLKTAKKFMQKYFDRVLSKSSVRDKVMAHSAVFVDHKGALQSYCQKANRSRPEYREEKPQKKGMRRVSVYCFGRRYGTAEAVSKKDAEKMAAEIALEALSFEYKPHKY